MDALVQLLEKVKVPEQGCSALVTGEVTPSPWGSASGFALCHHCRPGCACQREILPCHLLGLPSCIGWLHGHPIIWFYLLTQVMSLCAFVQVGVIFVSGPLVQFWGPTLPQCRAHPITLSPTPSRHGLVSCPPLVRLVKNVFGKAPQSHIITVRAVRRGQVGTGGP